MKFEQPSVQTSNFENPTQFVKVNNTENPVGHFVEVSEEHLLFPQVESLINQVIAPIYGVQENALEKIRNGGDRKCQLLMKDGEIVGVLVHKSEPNHEFTKWGG